MALTLIMMAGLPGTGKSTLALELGRKLGWLVLDKDLLNAVVLEHAQMAQSQAGPLSYELVLRLTWELLVQQSQSLILDTAGRQVFIYERACTIAQEAGAVLKVVQCQAPQAIRRERLAGRVSGPSQVTSDAIGPEQEQAWYAHLPEGRLILDTTQAFEHMVSQTLLFIRAE